MPLNSTSAAELQPQELEFEAMNLQVGVRLQFITHRQVKPVQHFSTLIGWLKDEYLIVKIPVEHGLPIPLVEGERLTIRVFSGVHVCTFACTVERVFGRPLLYAHLSFPTSIQGSNLRTAMRVKVEIPVQVSSPRAHAPANCYLVNLSVTGALIESPRRLPPGDDVTLQFTLVAPPGNKEVRVQANATIRNMNVVQAAPDGHEVFTYGVQFGELDPVHFTLLQNMTYEALLADRQNIV